MSTSTWGTTTRRRSARFCSHGAGVLVLKTATAAAYCTLKMAAPTPTLSIPSSSPTAVLPTSKTHTVDVRNALSSPPAIGLPVPPIPRPASVYRALVKEGHLAAEWMRQRCDFNRPLQVAALSPERGRVQERVEIPAVHLRAALAAAWPPPSPHAFQAALARVGLALAQGDSAVVVVDGCTRRVQARRPSSALWDMG